MKGLKYNLGQRVWVKGALFLGALLLQKWTQKEGRMMISEMKAVQVTARGA